MAGAHSDLTPSSHTRSPAEAKDQADPATDAKKSIRQLCLHFWAWKLLLLAIAAASPGPGYDTSTRVLLDSYKTQSSIVWYEQLTRYLVSRLTRWDAIYFATSSLRGHVHEQEWAFSPYLAKITSHIARAIPPVASPLVTHAAIGIVLSHVSHLVTVLSMYHLTYAIIPASHARKHSIALQSAYLHIISPAGLFLSASYGESFFALTSFAGMSLYLEAKRSYWNSAPRISWKACIYLIIGSFWFSHAVMTRGNGLLSGLIFLWDALMYLPSVPSLLHTRAWADLIHLGAIVLGGSVIAVAYASPQIVAYLEYCTKGNTRPWCDRIPPSIYTWVQDHYWKVGFFRYWTLSNLPLFALAAPMLVVLITTSWAALSKTQLMQMRLSLEDRTESDITKRDGKLFTHVLSRFALPQLVLAVLAATSFHVQIINRISSGYPVWYILLAIALASSEERVMQSSSIIQKYSVHARSIARAMVMYAIIQGGLYASFLPPA